MKSSIAVTTHGSEVGQPSAKSVSVHFRELSQAEIIYAMQKEDACHAARATLQGATSEENLPSYIQPGPGSCMF
jgi:hypothetical protein